jgi:hypothetical protein
MTKDSASTKAFKVLAGTVSAVLLAVVLPLPSIASNWYPDPKIGPQDYWLGLADKNPTPFSYMTTTVFPSASDRDQSKNRLGRYDCPQTEKYPCVPSATTNLFGAIVAPVCSGREKNCIRGLTAQADGVRVSGQFLGYLKDLELPSKPNWGLRGRGASMSFWDIPGVVHSGGATTYAVSVSYFVIWKNGVLEPYDFQTRIIPYSVEPAPHYREMVASPFTDYDGLPNIQYSAPGNGCAWFRQGVCGKAQHFPGGYQFGLDLNLEKDLSTWFDARLSDTNISVSSIGRFDNRVQVLGSPIEVPVFSYSLPAADLPIGLKSFLNSLNWPVTPGSGRGTETDGDFGIKFVEHVRPLVGDTAAATVSVWGFSNIPFGQYSNCLTRNSEISGIVSTNSMTYQSGPPKFRRGFLEYEVAGMHYLPGGTQLALGTYELIMKSSIARCLYNLPNVPLSGKVSVVNSKGQKTVATTSVSEKNGWIKLSAKGFTFSKKTIRVKITKAKR